MAGNKHVDGGWGWVVVVASFGICFLCDGIRYSYGLLYLEFLQEFHRGKSETSWIGSIMFGTYSLLGPVASVLMTRFGCRAATILGTVIVFAAYIISMFATSLPYLYVSFGVLGGFGFVLMMLPFNVIIVQYFEKNRTLAMAMAMCGTGVGTIVFNPLSKFLIDQYQWRGTLLIEAGMLLNGIVCGWAMQPLPTKSQNSKPPTEVDESPVYDHKLLINSFNNISPENTANKTTIIPEDASKLDGSTDNPKKISYNQVALNDKINDKHEDRHQTTIIKENKNACARDKSIEINKEVNINTVDSENPVDDDECSREHSTAGPQLQETSTENNDSISANIKSTYISKDAKCIHYKSIGDEVKELDDEFTSDEPLLQGINTINGEHNIGQQESDTKTIKSNSKTLKEFLHGIYHFELLTDPAFLVFLLSVIFIGFSFMVPFTYLPDMAISKGFTRGDAAWILSAIGIANTVFRVPAGLLGDRQSSSRWNLYIASILVTSVSIVCMPLSNNYYLLMAASVIFGLSTGIFVVLFPIVLADVFGDDVLGDSFGLILFGSGISVLLGPPLSGWVFDKTGDYLISFIIAGVEFFLGGVVLLLVPILKRSKQRATSQKTVA